MAELPYLPLKVPDLLSDTQHMTSEEFGAYCRLLFTMWLHGARLPNVPDELARIAGVTRARWDEIAPSVLRPISRTENTISQKRLSKTWARAMALHRRRQEVAAKMWQTRRR